MLALRLRPPNHGGSTYEYILISSRLVETFKNKYPGNILGCCYEILELSLSHTLLFGNTSVYRPEIIKNLHVSGTSYAIEFSKGIYELYHGDNDDMIETFKEFPNRNFMIILDFDWRNPLVKRSYLGGQPCGAY